LLVIATGALLPQTGGQITGEVIDQSGATIPDATGKVTNSATKVARTTTTTSVGLYSFPALNPGFYQFKITVAGFQTAVTNDIQLQVQPTVRIDFSLSVGQATQTLEVAAKPPSSPPMMLPSVRSSKRPASRTCL